jgi:hypothetical protein
MIIQRRVFLTGLVAAFAAPAIVKAAWIMPVKKVIVPEFRFYSSLYRREFTVEEWQAIEDDRLDAPVIMGF